jgi:hypothetical protein
MRMTRVLIVFSILYLTACTLFENTSTSSQQDTASQIYTAAALTEQSFTPTPGPLPLLAEQTNTPPPIPSVTPNRIVTVPVNVDLLNLREGPGILFPILLSLPRGTNVSTIGMTPDGKWIKVIAIQGNTLQTTGWMIAEYLDLSSLETSLPIEQWPIENTISGTMKDDTGNPINDVRVMVIFQADLDGIWADATSNRSGNFFIYAPPNLTGTFHIEIVAVNCYSSISKIMPDGSCVVQDYFPVTWKTESTLPQTQTIEFSYEQAVAFLDGKVVYQDGNGASQILIKATRQSDGVESEFVTPQGGAYRLPLGLGTWEVVAIRFLQDGTPLFSETRIFEVSTTGQEFEPLLISYTEIIER